MESNLVAPIPSEHDHFSKPIVELLSEAGEPPASGTPMNMVKASHSLASLSAGSSEIVERGTSSWIDLPVVDSEMTDDAIISTLVEYMKSSVFDDREPSLPPQQPSAPKEAAHRIGGMQRRIDIFALLTEGGLPPARTGALVARLPRPSMSDISVPLYWYYPHSLMEEAMVYGHLDVLRAWRESMGSEFQARLLHPHFCLQAVLLAQVPVLCWLRTEVLPPLWFVSHAAYLLKRAVVGMRIGDQQRCALAEFFFDVAGWNLCTMLEEALRSEEADEKCVDEYSGRQSGSNSNGHSDGDSDGDTRGVSAAPAHSPSKRARIVLVDEENKSYTMSARVFKRTPSPLHKNASPRRRRKILHLPGAAEERWLLEPLLRFLSALLLATSIDEHDTLCYLRQKVGDLDEHTREALLEYAQRYSPGPVTRVFM